MLLIVNATKNVRFRLLPKFKVQRDKELWYFEVCWLCFQTTLYSKALGNELTVIVNRATKGDPLAHKSLHPTQAEHMRILCKLLLQKVIELTEAAPDAK